MSTRPTLVLLPGLDGTGRLFARLEDALAREVAVEVVVYPEERTLGLDALVDLVLDRTPTGVPYVLVAESFSGPIAVEVAARRPRGLVGLVLVASFVAPPVRGLRAVLLRLAARVAFRLRPPAPAVRRWMTGGVDGGLVEEVRVAVGGVRPAVLAQRLGLVLSLDVRARLGELGVPVLALRATDDRLVREPIEGVREVLVDGPHLLLQVRPRECARTLLEFLGS